MICNTPILAPIEPLCVKRPPSAPSLRYGPSGDALSLGAAMALRRDETPQNGATAMIEKEYYLYVHKPDQRLGQAFVRAYLTSDEAIRCARLYMLEEPNVTEVEIYAHWNAGNSPRCCCIYRERAWSLK